MKEGAINRYAMLLIDFCLWFAMYVFAPYYTPYLLDIGIAAVSVGIINGLYGFLQMATKIPAGLYTDRRQKYKPFVALGLACGSAACFLMGAFPREPAMYVGRILTGLATSIWSLFLVMYARACSDIPAPVAIARMQLFSFLGRLAAYGVSALILARFSMAWVFYCGGFVALLGTVVSLFISEVPFLPPDPGSRRPLRLRLRVMGEPNLLFCSVLMMLYQLVAFATVSNYTQVVAKGLGATTAQLSAVSTLNMVFVMGGTFLMNIPAFARIRLSRLMGLSFLATGGYCLLVPACASIPQLMAVSAAAGLAGGVIITRLASACIAHVPGGEKSAAMGFHQAVYALGITLGPPVMSRLMAGYGSRTSFVWMGVISLACAASCALLFPLLKRRNDQ